MLVPAAATRAAQSKNQAECAVAFMRSPILTSVEIGCAFVREYCLWLLVYSGFTVTLEHFRVDVILEGVPSGAVALYQRRLCGTAKALTLTKRVYITANALDP